MIVIAIGAALGQWQLDRADAKRSIEVKLSERSSGPALPLDGISASVDELEYRKVRLTGEFIKDWPLYLDNRPHMGRAGFYVLMPFRSLNSSSVTLIQRGWIPRNPQDRARLPPLATPAGTLTIEGQVRRAPGNVMKMGQAPALMPGAILQNLDLVELARTSGLPIQPFMVQQTGDIGDGLTRGWPLPSSGIDRHLGYAFQWYALAAVAGIFFIVTGFKRAKPAKPATE
ncbi:MAG: SURF1 family protein [Pseudomonadota bacterium]